MAKKPAANKKPASKKPSGGAKPGSTVKPPPFTKKPGTGSEIKFAKEANKRRSAATSLS